MPHHAELTTQEAVDFLNVSRPFLVELLESGQLPHHKVGTHRRVRFSDLMTYKRRRDAESEAALRELSALSQDYETLLTIAVHGERPGVGKLCRRI